MSSDQTSEDTMTYNLNPSDEYELNLFLIDIANEITEDDLKKLKFLIGGRGGSGKATLERIDDALDYFNHLRQKNLLSLDNFCLLQAFVWKLGRKDLYRKCVDFGRRLKRTLYFFAPRETPENGYKHVKFHLEGKTSRSKVDSLRDDLARLLWVDREFVIVDGVELSNSLTITFMIPEECEEVLSTLSNKEKFLLFECGVDQFTVNGNITFITENTSPVLEDEEVLAKRELVLKEKRLQKELDMCHSELILCKKKIKHMKEDLFTQQREMANKWMLMQIASTLHNQFMLQQIRKEKIAHPLQVQAAQKYLKVLLEKVNSLRYDRKLIDELLQINGHIVKANVTSAYVMLIRQLAFDVEKLNTSVMQQDYIIQRLTFAVGRSIEEVAGPQYSNEFFQYVMMQNAMQGVLPLIQLAAPTMTLDDASVDNILYRLTMELKQKERDELKKSVSLKSVEEETLRKDSNRLLEVLRWHNRKPGPFDLGKFVHSYLKQVNRQDLIPRYNEMLHEIQIKNQNTQGQNQPATSSADTQGAKGTTKHKPKDSNSQTSSSKLKSDEDSETLSSINSRLQKMENMMEKMAVNSLSSPLSSRGSYFDDQEKIKKAAQTFFSNRYGADPGASFVSSS